MGGTSGACLDARLNRIECRWSVEVEPRITLEKGAIAGLRFSPTSSPLLNDLWLDRLKAMGPTGSSFDVVLRVAISRNARQGRETQQLGWSSAL